METKFFKSQDIVPGIIFLRGSANDNAYLLLGDRYALLIDTMTGAGSLREFCTKLTDLPIKVALTHGHLDHYGGCFEFGECYIHPADIDVLYIDTSAERRLKFIEGMNGGETFVRLEDITVPCALQTYPLYEGDFFDLGNRRIEVIGVPGHSTGSLVFYDPSSRILFSGDACNTNTLLFLDGSTSIRTYRESLLGLQKRRGDFDYFWGGHGNEPLSPDVILQGIELCDKIISGTDDAVLGGTRRLQSEEVQYFYAKPRMQDLSANIAYRRDRIHEAPLFRRPPVATKC
jgi:glyoxylase-like metal-dependent hydrolase (beta-lactamase superfamily II)